MAGTACARKRKMNHHDREHLQRWTNYETWVTALWLNNEEGSYHEIRRIARHGNTAQALEALVTESAPNVQGLYSDLLTHALGRVNWDEIARSLEEELQEEE